MQSRFSMLVVVLLVAWTAAPSARGEVIVLEVPKNTGLEKDFQRAKASSVDAIKAFESGNVTGALAHAESAYRVYPNTSTAMVMARIYAHGKNDRKAFEWFLRARNHGPSEAFLVKVNAGLFEHGRTLKLGTFKASVEPTGAALKLSGDSIPNNVFVGVSLGEYALEVSMGGYEPSSQRIKIASTDPVAVSVILSPLAKSSVEVSSGLPAAPLALIIGGVVAAGAGVGLHVWGLGRDGGLDTDNGRWASQGLGVDAARESFSAATDDATLGTTIAFVLYGVGGAAILTGAILWALDEPTPSNGTADVVVAPAYMRGGGGLVLSGGF